MKKENKELLLQGAYFLIAAFLAWNVYQLRSRNTTLQASLDRYQEYLATPVYQDRALPILPDSTLPSLRINYINREGFLTIGRPNPKPQLLIVFTPDDCASCFTETPFWERLKVVFGDRVEIAGIISSRTVEDSARLIRRHNINIPVAYDSEGRLLNFLKLRKTRLTPVKVFVNVEGHVLHEARTTYANALAQLRYSRALLTLLDQSRGIQSELTMEPASAAWEMNE